MKLILLFALLSMPALAQEKDRLEELTRRIEELERQQDELMIQGQFRSNPVNSFLRNNLTLGGFLEVGVTGIEGEDTELQIVNSSNILGLNLAADYNSKLRFVSQLLVGLTYPLQNLNNNPGGGPDERRFGDVFFGALLSQGYVEYILSNHFRIQAGVGYAPFGYALQQRELVLFWRRSGPQILRTPQLVSPLWSGIQLLGEFSRKGGGEWGYHFYTSNPINPAEARMMGVGGRLWMGSENEAVVGGLSAQMGKYNSGTDEIVGSDLRVRMSNFNLITEYARHITEGEDVWTAYVEPGVFIRDESLLLFAFADYADNPLNTVLDLTRIEIIDGYKKWEYGAGINWLPTAYTRFRLTLTKHDYVGEDAVLSGQNRDFYSVDISAGVAF